MKDTLFDLTTEFHSDIEPIMDKIDEVAKKHGIPTTVKVIYASTEDEWTNCSLHSGINDETQRGRLNHTGLLLRSICSGNKMTSMFIHTGLLDEELVTFDAEKEFDEEMAPLIVPLVEACKKLDIGLLFHCVYKRNPEEGGHSRVFVLPDDLGKIPAYFLAAASLLNDHPNFEKIFECWVEGEDLRDKFSLK